METRSSLVDVGDIHVLHLHPATGREAFQVVEEDAWKIVTADPNAGGGHVSKNLRVYAEARTLEAARADLMEQLDLFGVKGNLVYAD